MPGLTTWCMKTWTMEVCFYFWWGVTESIKFPKCSVCQKQNFSWLGVPCTSTACISAMVANRALFVACLLNVPATCKCISETDLLGQFCLLSHWEKSCRSNLLSHPVTVNWHRASHSWYWPLNVKHHKLPPDFNPWPATPQMDALSTWPSWQTREDGQPGKWSHGQCHAATNSDWVGSLISCSVCECFIIVIPYSSAASISDDKQVDTVSLVFHAVDGRSVFWRQSTEVCVL